MDSKESYKLSRRSFRKMRDDLIKAYDKEFSGNKYVVFENDLFIGVYDSEEDAWKNSSEINDHRWMFKLVSREDERKEYSSSEVSTWSLISEPFLDTDMPEWIYRANKTLKERGYSKNQILLLRIFAGTGLWWNIIWWEWGHFDGWDILQGWGCNSILIGFFASFISYIYFSSRYSTGYAILAGILVFAFFFLIFILISYIVNKVGMKEH
jgi:hypothetical protein